MDISSIVYVAMKKLKLMLDGTDVCPLLRRIKDCDSDNSCGGYDEGSFVDLVKSYILAHMEWMFACSDWRRRLLPTFKDKKVSIDNFKKRMDKHVKNRVRERVMEWCAMRVHVKKTYFCINNTFLSPMQLYFLNWYLEYHELVHV